jgi:hypothetical protein
LQLASICYYYYSSRTGTSIHSSPLTKKASSTEECYCYILPGSKSIPDSYTSPLSSPKVESYASDDQHDDASNVSETTETPNNNDYQYYYQNYIGGDCPRRSGGLHSVAVPRQQQQQHSSFSQ